jgi:hypothetical protein
VDVIRRHWGEMSGRQSEHILDSVRGRLTVRRRARALRLVAVGLSAAAAAVVLIVRHHGRVAPISFQVEGGDLHPGGFVEANDSSRPVVRFSDGSEVVLSEQARAHVRSVDEHGAHVTLDEGRVHVYVVHSPASRWSFDAGPFVVEVTGTSFGLSWLGAEHKLDVRLENGAVNVRGPEFDTPLALHAGQWLTVDAHNVLIRDLGSVDAAVKKEPVEPESSAAAESQPELSVPRHVGRRAPAPPPAPPATAVPRLHWTIDLADGKFATIVDEASRMGFETAFSSTGSDDLAALADAARYTRRFDVARGAFMAQRSRFPASERARVAAFSLGRLFETQRDVRVALSWFETYLLEAPEGVFASEALGRKMLLVDQLDGKDAARPLAETYLRRFPEGTYAQTAHALTAGP